MNDSTLEDRDARNKTSQESWETYYREVFLKVTGAERPPDGVIVMNFDVGIYNARPGTERSAQDVMSGATVDIPAALLTRYTALKNKVTQRREQFSALMEFIEQETVYLTTPASTKYHLCRRYGLLEHSINVAETMFKIKSAIAPEILDESCVIVALLHDLGKAGVPGKPQYLENPPDSKYKNPYYWNNDLVYLSVPVRSLYLIAPLFPLVEEEAQAIIYHDGQYVDDNHSVSTHEEPLTLLLQYADTWSGFVVEHGK